jgi:hypothetical protein
MFEQTSPVYKQHQPSPQELAPTPTKQKKNINQDVPVIQQPLPVSDSVPTQPPVVVVAAAAAAAAAEPKKTQGKKQNAAIATVWVKEATPLEPPQPPAEKTASPKPQKQRKKKAAAPAQAAGVEPASTPTPARAAMKPQMQGNAGQHSVDAAATIRTRR